MGLALGLSLPLIGVFVVLRKEALLSDALSHVILLGIALAVVFKINITLGIFSFALLAALGIYYIKNKAGLGLDTIVGVFFTTALAVASLIIPSEGLLESFLGDLGKITKGDVIISFILALAIILTLLIRFREFAFTAFAPDLAQVDKLDVKKYELIFTLILALGVAIGIKLAGALLISALIIIPAATAKIFSLQIRSMTIWSMALGLVAVFTGLAGTIFLNYPSGPAIILVSSAMFFLTFLFQAILKTRN